MGRDRALEELSERHATIRLSFFHHNVMGSWNSQIWILLFSETRTGTDSAREYLARLLLNTTETSSKPCCGSQYNKWFICTLGPAITIFCLDDFESKSQGNQYRRVDNNNNNNFYKASYPGNTISKTLYIYKKTRNMK